MRKQIGMVFVLVFFTVATIYAFLAAFTTVLYRNKDISDLSQIERDILYGRATLGGRLVMFVTSILGSLYFPPCWIIALLAMGIYWLIVH